MKSNKITIIAIGIAVIMSSQICTGMEQLDAEGQTVINELAILHNQLIRSARFTITKLNFDFEEWNLLLHSNVKSYVEDNSKVLGIKDSDLIHYFNLLVHGSNSLQAAIKRVQNYKKPERPLNETDIHMLTQSLLEPIEKISQNIKNIIMPRIANLSFITPSKKKAQAMLYNVFRLLQQMAEAMEKHTAAIIFMDLK